MKHFHFELARLALLNTHTMSVCFSAQFVWVLPMILPDHPFGLRRNIVFNIVTQAQQRFCFDPKSIQTVSRDEVA